MKIALVNPNFEGSVESKRAYIPLGLASIAAVIREQGKHQLKVIDAAALNLNDIELEKQLKNFGAEAVGLGAVSDLLEPVVNVCEIAKRLGIKTIVGGVHPTILPKETLSFEEIDIVIIGEGEYTFIELLDALEKKKNLEEVRGIMFKKKGKKEFVKTPFREHIKDLNKLPFPARDLFPWKIYSSYSSIIRKTPCMHMMTSRGCPFHCTFCASQSLWKGCIARSSKNIADEIEHLIKEFGVKEIYLFDDTFNLDLKRSEEICDEIIRRKIKISLRVQARVWPMTTKLLKKMKKAGVWCIYYGVESGNEKVLKDMKKSIKLEKIRETFKMTKKIGIKTFGFFMIGLPSDTRETIRDTFNFALELDPDFVNFTILVVYPGTEIYELAVKEGSIKRIGPKEIFHPRRYTHKTISDKELQKKLGLIYKKFYMRPKYMIKRFFGIRTLTELKANFIAGLPFLKGKNNPFNVAKKWIPID
jgi:anaerobic magnesium-protoporphyrin IX monomethyl ester cyclase